MYWHLMVEAKKLAYSDLLAKQRRSEVRDRAGERAALEVVRRDACAARSIRTPRRSLACGGGTRRRDDLSDDGRSLGQHGVADSQRVQRLRQPRDASAPYGFVLHNRGSAFSLDPKSPNVVAPRKRPFHTIIAGFVMKDGQPLMTFGNMGGSVQPETHAQHMVNLIDLGHERADDDRRRALHAQPEHQTCCRSKRTCSIWSGAALKAKGHEVRAVNGGSVGGYQGILFTRDPRLPEPTFDRAASPTICRSTACIAPARTTARTVRRWDGEESGNWQIGRLVD